MAQFDGGTERERETERGEESERDWGRRGRERSE